MATLDCPVCGGNSQPDSSQKFIFKLSKYEDLVNSTECAVCSAILTGIRHFINGPDNSVEMVRLSRTHGPYSISLDMNVTCLGRDADMFPRLRVSADSGRSYDPA
jgi:hypothetical protein